MRLIDWALVHTVYKVDTSDEDEATLRQELAKVLAGKLKSHSLEFTPPADLQSSRPTLRSSPTSLDGVLLAQADDAAAAAEDAIDPTDEDLTITDDDATENDDATEGGYGPPTTGLSSYFT